MDEDNKDIESLNDIESSNETILNNKKRRIDDFFGISKNNTTIKIEIIAGIVTFLAMCYILVVNPNNLIDPNNEGINAANVSWTSIFIATAFGAFFGTFLMAIVAKMPLAQAPGMGLNYTIGTTFIGAFGGVFFTFGQAMLLVLITGIIFLLLSIIPGKRDKKTGRLIALRELIFDGIPDCIRKSIPIGIGLFIAFIGLKNANIISGDPGTLVKFVTLNNKDAWKLGKEGCQAMVALFGFIIIVILNHFKIKGSVILGILSAAILAIPLKVADIDALKGNEQVSWKFWLNFKDFFIGSKEYDSAFVSVFRDGFKGWNSDMIVASIVLIITFSMIDMFDTMGTVVGCTKAAGLTEENGKPKNYNKIMISDSFATVVGSIFGTSTVTTFVESGSGIAEGGKTGLVSFTTAILFLLAVFIAPIFAFVPEAACAPALIFVGVLMMRNVIDIDFKEIRYAAPAFLTILFMPLAYSITTGVGLGVVSFVIINFVIWIVQIIEYKRGKIKEKPKLEISIILLIIFILFMLYFLLPSKF